MVALCFSIPGVLMVTSMMNYMRFFGFMSSTIGNILWISFGIGSAEYSVAALFAIYMIINMIGARKNKVDRKTIVNIIYDKIKITEWRCKSWANRKINGFRVCLNL